MKKGKVLVLGSNATRIEVQVVALDRLVII